MQQQIADIFNKFRQKPRLKNVKEHFIVSLEAFKYFSYEISGLYGSDE